MTVTLRRARETDAGRVGIILSEFIDDTPWMPRLHTRAQDIGFAGSMIERGWVTVAERGGSIEGFIACEDTEVNALYIAELARRSGIGSALLQGAMARHTELTLWTFQCNDAARRFYAAHGFAERAFSDGDRNEEGLPDVQLVWKRGAA